MEQQPTPRTGPPPPPGAGSREPAAAIRRGEPLPDAIQRLSLHFLAQAADTLSRPDRTAVAERAWRVLARSRALLRLIRGAIGDRAYLFEDSQLREAMRLITPARDAAVLPAALEGLIHRFSDRLSGVDSARLLGDPPRASDSDVARVLEVLTAARVRYALFGTDAFGDDFATIEPGLRLTYAKGQLRMGEAFRRSTDLSYHKWGTQVGYLRDQTAMLDPDWSALGLSERLRRLAATLEEAGRLALLAAAVGGGENEEDGELLRLLAVGRCRELYGQLLVLGERVYGEEPAAFTAGFGAYWEGWRSD